MRVLIACEYSGTVRRAFRALGHDAWSCDLIASDDDSPFHIQGDVLKLLSAEWDLMIAHPPCTHLAVAGAKHFKNKQHEQEEALGFVRHLMECPVDKIALENPVSIISTRIRKPDQIINPWQFGHQASKRTCLWLKNLPLLIPTDIVDKGEYSVTKSGKRIPKWYNLPPSADRWKIRSRTFEGIANAMAQQWGKED